MGCQLSPRVTSLPRISTSSYLESKRRLSRDCSAVITAVATAPAAAPRKLVCSIGSGISGIRQRLPLLETPLDERRPLGGIVAVQHGLVCRVGTEVDPGG